MREPVFPPLFFGKIEKFSSDLIFCLNPYYAALQTVSTVFFKIIRQFRFINLLVYAYMIDIKGNSKLTNNKKFFL